MKNVWIAHNQCKIKYPIGKIVQFKWRSCVIQPFQQYQGTIVGHNLVTHEDSMDGSVSHKHSIIVDTGNAKLYGIYDDWIL